MNFVNLKLDRNIADLVNANFCLHFCNKTYFEKFWNVVISSLKTGGIFVGNFLGEKDSWNCQKVDMIFFNDELIKELFKGFEIIKFEEVEKEGKTVLGNNKHWHIYNVIAKKL